MAETTFAGAHHHSGIPKPVPTDGPGRRPQSSFPRKIARMNKPAISAAFALSIALLSACARDADPTPAPAAPSESSAPQASPAAFVDVTAESNLAWQVGYTRPPLIRNQRAVTESTFGGAAAGDCDADGDIDLFVTYGNTGGPDGGGGPNRLYLNQLAEQDNGLLFEDVAEQAGVANTRPDGRNDRHSGPAFADLDGDGDLDLFLGGLHDDPSRIYENQGDCRFVDVTENSPEIVNMLASHTMSASFGDYDLDGDLDMFLTHWATPDLIYVGADYERIRETDHLWRNESDESGIRFVNVSEETGVSDLTWSTRASDFYIWPQDADFTFTATFARINGDSWPDIAIAADFGTTQLAINNGDGTFRALDDSILRDAQFGMGSALGDFDNDGDLDWFVTSIKGPGDESIYLVPWGNRLYRNDGTGFVDDTARLGVADGSWGWGACFVDLDNDADLDIYHTNGWSEPYLGHQVWQTPSARAFVQNAAGTYDEAASALGLAENTSSRGVVCADFDHDGDIDILELTDSIPNSPRLWENRSAAAGHNFLRVKLEGLPPNTEAAGARIFVQTGEKRQMREIMIGSNYTSQNPTVQIFGLGAATAVDEILVEWPAIDSGDGPEQLGSLLSGPIAASQPGQTIVIRHPGLPPR
jgi:hypothetical protein